MRANEFLAELGDRPYQMKPRWTNDGGQDKKTVILPDNKGLEITVDQMDDFALVNFYVNQSQRLTGGGDAVAIFSTVINELQDFVRKRRPPLLVFTGSYDDASRIRLYDRLANRLVTTPAFSGYKNISDTEELWPEDLQYRMDDIQDVTGQKTYVLASPQYLRSIGYR
jgi:hypothetical protein